jgi:ABC-type branched-subunit amino acid transport system permease subunit
MFAISAILIGVVGVLYVRRRSSRKKTAAAR